jgi:RecB family exonuclease
MKKISYSGIRKFCNCRRAYRYNYIDNIVPVIEPDSLVFGTAWHEVLAHYYDQETISLIDSSKIRKEPHLNAMLKGYCNMYVDKDFKKILAVELPFEIYIRSPHKKRALKGIRFRGIIDMVVERNDGNIWIIEHKTASIIDGKYIDRLWHDLQIMLYAYAYQEMTGKKVTGIIYNVAQKTRIKQGKGETPEEYNARYTELCAKSKTGKSSAKRKMPETDQEFEDRLNKVYENPEMFHREEILCDTRRIEEVKSELWDIAKSMNTKDFYKNRSQCFNFGECEYFRICNSGENPIVIENYYKERGDRK